MAREDYPYCSFCMKQIGQLVVEGEVVVYKCFHCGKEVEVEIYES